MDISKRGIGWRPDIVSLRIALALALFINGPGWSQSVGNGDGLLGGYFDNRHLSGTPVILSRLSGQRVADNGFHVGVVILENVFDNYYSNVPLMTWPLLYEVIRPKIGVDNTVTLMRAHGEGFGQLKLFRDAPPRSRYDPRWDSAGSDVIDVPVIE